MNLIQYWDQGPPPGRIAAHRRTWIEGPDGLEALLFDRESGGRLLERRFGRREAAALAACAVPAMASDLFRYGAVAALGGFYIDASWRQRSALAPLLARVEAAGRGGFLVTVNDLAPVLARNPVLAQAAGAGLDVAVNGILCCPEAGHDFPRAALALAVANVEARAAEDIGFVTGSGVVTLLANLPRFPSLSALEAAIAPLTGPGGAPAGAVATMLGALEAFGFERARAAAADMALVPIRETSAHFLRPEAEWARGPDHWSRHAGSIFRD